MPFEITNSLRGTSVIRGVDAGTYTITLNDLRANATIESVSAADIKRIMWSTNGSITVVRNGVPQLALHTGGVMDFADFAHSLANNNTQSIVVTINTGGSFIMEVSKVATYNVDPYTGASI
jgi:hypothetical protein